MIVRTAILAVLMMAATASASPAQTLRPTLSAAPPSVREQVTVGAAGSAFAMLAIINPRTNRILAGRRADYESIVAGLAKANDVPAELIHRIIVRESKYQPHVMGRGGAMGMMQIKLATARGMGFGGTADELLDARTNLHWGVKYLAGAWRAAQGDPDLAVRKYAAGYYVSRARRAAAR